MSKKDFLIIILLAVSIGFSVIIWQEVKDVRANQVGFARRDQVDRLESDVSEAVQAIEGLAKEQKWVQESYFTLNKEKSSGEQMSVKGNFLFKVLPKDQVPYIIFRKKGDTDWVKQNLTKVGALSFETDIVISPFYEYEYQIISSDEETEIASAMGYIPYNIYGLPKWKTEIQTSTASGFESVEFNIYIYMDVNSPLEEMQPEKASLVVGTDKGITQVYSFKDGSDKSEGLWNLKWTLSSASVIDMLDANVEVEYKNGLKRTEKVELFKERVLYEFNKKDNVVTDKSEK